MKRKAKKHSSGNIGRTVRSVVSIVVLSAFVLAISYFVKGVSTFDSNDFLKIANPILTKVGVDDEKFGEVAGKVSKRLGNYINIPGESTESSEPSNPDVKTADEDSGKTEELTLEPSTEVVTEVALMSDSHNYNGMLEQALNKVKERGITTVFYLGDFTDWGEVTWLQTAKEILDGSGLAYYAQPGDHDLADSATRGLSAAKGFNDVFGKNYQSVKVGDTAFVILDNSANYTAISNDEMNWFETEVIQADFVLLHQPVYHPTNPRVMGMVDGDTVKLVKDQATAILAQTRKAEVKAIIAGDQHQYSVSDDPEDSRLKHVVIGALTGKLNKPQFVILRVLKNGDFETESVVLE